MADRTYFCFLLEWADMFALLTDEQSGKMINAMIVYEKDGIEPVFADDILSFAWLSNVKPKMDTLQEHYQEKIRQASEAGKASAEKRRQKKQMSDSVQQIQRTSTDVESVQRNEQASTDSTDIDLDLDIDIDLVNKEKYKKEKDDFDVFWKEYPRKVGKGAARKSFEKAVKKTDVQTMIDAVRKQKESEQWTRDNGQYIPHPATWLNQERWEDELSKASRIPIRKNDSQLGFARAAQLLGITGE